MRVKIFGARVDLESKNLDSDYLWDLYDSSFVVVDLIASWLLVV